MDQSNFEIQPVESDIDRVGQQAREHMAGNEAIGHHEAVREALRPMVQPQQTPSAAVPPSATAVDDTALPSYLKDSAPEMKHAVERLVEDAFKYGVEHAAEEAQKAGPFVVDALHDALTDRFYDELKRRNLI